MCSLAKIRKGLDPAPVYVGWYDDGSVSRMSFWSQAGKPLDIERGRRIVATNSRAAFNNLSLERGYVVWEGEIVQIDDMASAPEKPKRRPSGKQVGAVLIRLLDYLDNYAGDPEILKEARDIAQLAA